ncbi:MAG: hypothetical protein V4850_30530 [Myxococcota bacterium]
MECFKLVYEVLSEIYDGDPRPEATKDAAIKKQLDYLRDQYVTLASATTAPVDYNDAATRFAYVYRYTTSHANLVASVIGAVPALREILEQDKVTIACVGGGPGSDFLGVVKHKLAAGKDGSLKAFLLDKERAWGETWADVDEHMDGVDFKLSTFFQDLDVTDSKSWGGFTKYLSADLITMIYFVSEVWAVRAQAEAYFKHLFDKAPSGTLFLFIDNNAAVFYEWFDKLTSSAGLTTVASAESGFRLPNHEQKSELGRFFDKFSYPKITANVAYRVLRKP